MDEDLKQIGRSLWHDKPLLITVAAGLAVLIFILWKKSQGSVVAPIAPATPAATGNGATYVENSYSYTSTVLPTPTTSPTGLPFLPGPIIPRPVASPQPVGTTGHAPGTTFLGPTGVKHYVTTGMQTLRQIAKQFRLSTWNSIYAIPDNQRILGRMDASHAANDKPAAGTVITLPGNTSVGF